MASNMYKTITVNANAKKIVTLKCIWYHICAKLLFCRQMLRKSLLTNAFGTKYVQNCYFEGKCSGNHYLKMHLLQNMYNIITLKANAKKIITWKCVSHQICTKSLHWRQMLRKSSLENAFGIKYVQNCYFESKCSGNH